MFDSKTKEDLVIANKEIDRLREVINRKNLDAQMNEEKLIHDHALELQQNEFDLKHYKDKAIQDKDAEIVELTKKVAVLTKENQMLDKITDLNSDVIDVKKLVSDLIGKLPNVDIKSINVSTAK